MKLALPLISLLLMLSGCGRSLDADATRLFNEAENSFAAARSPQDFLKAAAIDQEILDRGWVSGAVYYNQGNSFMRAGQRGRAIAAYRQAERYLGHDPLLEANLAYALGTSVPSERRPLVENILFWQDWINYPNKFLLAAIAVLATFMMLVTALFIRRRVLTRLIAVGVLASVVLIISAGYDCYRYTAQLHGVTVENKTIVRKGNAESYEPALTAPLDEGAEFQLIEHRGNWLWIRLPGDQQGWIPEQTAVVY